MKPSPIFSALHELAALVGAPDAARHAETPLGVIEQELWTAFSTPLGRAELAAVAYALARLCAVSDTLTAGGRSLSADNRSAADALAALVDCMPALRQPGDIPDSAAFRALMRKKAPRGEQDFRHAAECAWEACICAVLSGI